MQHQQLSPDELDAIAALERRVRERDGLKLKLEWGALRAGRAVATLTEHDGETLVGFLGVYAFAGPPDAEITGMVAPGHRRRGVATRLLERAFEVCERESLSDRLLVIPRASAGGAAFADHHGARLSHCEYSMVLRQRPDRVAEEPLIALRQAADVDRADLIRILSAGFGPPPESVFERLHDGDADTLMIDYDGRPVGTIRLTRRAGEAAIHGFAIDPEHRGRGIGRVVLGRACTELLDGGAEAVGLEVEIENDSALSLYTSVGFAPVSTEDYYRL